MSEWQPIEMAPKVGNGGPLILTWSRKDGANISRWSHVYWVTIPGGYARKPTHWMPLPEPPK